MPSPNTRCPSCNTRLFYLSTGDGHVRLRASILVFKSESAVAVCRKCKEEVAVELELGDGLRKALQAPGPQLVLRKSLDPRNSAP